MITGPNGYSSSVLMNILSGNSNKLEDLTVQLSTGKKSLTYSGLGGDVGQSLDLRAQISSIDGFRSTIDQAQLQISMMDVSLQRLVDIGSEVSGSATSTQYDITAENQSVGQMTAATLVKEALGLLDTEVDGDFVFSGTTSDVQPTRSYDQIVNGMTGQDGLITVTDERMRADAGSDGRGRLDLSTTGSIMTMSEQVTDFGYKLSAVSSTLSNATVTGPTGSPASISVALTAAPSANEAMSFTFELPDGSSKVVRLVAANGITMPGEGNFSLNGTPDDIAAAIEVELAFQIEQSVATEGEAASRIQAAQDFFLTGNGGEPKRVVGTPETATTLDTATAAGKPTVNWYVGDNSIGSARDTAVAQVDSRLDISYGARANEDSIARQLAYMTAFSLPTFDENSSLDKNRYGALADAISSGLSSVNQGDVVKTIQTQLGVASKVMKDADTRHMTTTSMLQTVSDNIEGVDTEEVAAKIMTLKNTIEASYQAASMMYQLTLTNYI
ncbi:hypothetical protein [Cohaesibacter celericrescens]|uniref:Uncharacterized protein n=1 Tax=Cohaesibacter celericrescens TaxID=2067669 RepID=A0A2N5XLZ0_9HYPH|nr:hypothetical protein [Cohaesibacter celericrescens]PLW75448.1 hypothetical protein C0081_19065 [Cohaesibacter celericrescens]PLW78855.1 hypothetical protein C0081_01025 [Cohaesibacter celericrescens]